MERIHRLGLVILVTFLFTGAAQACYLHGNISFNGFQTAHPGTLQVSMAMRDAIKDGRLPELPRDPEQRREALGEIQSAVVTDIEALATARADGPPVSVLLVQSGVWIRLNDPEAGARYHSGRPVSGEGVVLLPDVAYGALIDGALTIPDLETAGLLRVYAEDKPVSLEVFGAAMVSIANARAERPDFETSGL